MITGYSSVNNALRPETMKYTVGLLVSLSAFWLLLSGHYTPLILAFGAASVLLVAWIARRMRIVDNESPASGFNPRLVAYWLWLLGQILRSALRVSRIVLSAPAAVRPAIGETPNSTHDPLNQVIYANSITLTPGTLSVAVHDELIEVHALEAGSLQTLDRGEMRRRVQALHRA